MLRRTVACLGRMLLCCVIILYSAVPALGESGPAAVLVGQTGDIYLHCLTADNGQQLYFASLQPEAPVLETDLNGDELMDLAVLTRMGASNRGQEFFLRSGDCYVPVRRLGSGEDAFYNYTRSEDGRYIATNASNGYAGALFDNALYTWSGTDLQLLRRAVSQPKVETQVTDNKLITTEYQDVLTIRVWDYAQGIAQGNLLFQAEVNLYDEDALKAALTAANSLMAFPQ